MAIARQFETIAEMRQFTGADCVPANVKGYYIAGDLGGGIFNWDSTSLLPDDGGSVIAPTVVGPGRWIAELGNTFNAARFGIKSDGNGVGGGTDNWSQLVNLNAYIRDHNGLTINFPPGIMCSTKSNWLLQIKDVTLDFSGCKVQNIVNPYNGDIAFAVGDTLFSKHSVGNIFHGYVQPYFINTVAQTSQSVTTTTASDAANLIPGAWAAVLGYDQQGSGFPPNLRYRDYVKIVSVNASTGVINLDRPLRHSYNSAWFPIPNYVGSFTYGPAAIIPLDFPLGTIFGDTITVRNLETLANPYDVVPVVTNPSFSTFQSNNAEFFGARLFTIENLITQNCFVGDSDEVIMENCQIGVFQPDKNTNRLVFRGGSVYQFAGSTGMDEVLVEGTDITWVLDAEPRRLLVKKCKFSGVNGDQPFSPNASLYGQLIQLEDCTFDYPTFSPLITGAPMNTSVGAPDRPGPNSTTVVATGAGTLSVALGGGFRISAGPGTVLRRVTDGARFIVNDITYDGVNNVISYTSQDTPVVADVLYYNPIMEMTWLNNVRTVHNTMPTIYNYRPSEFFQDDRGYDFGEVNFIFDWLTDGPRQNFLSFQTDGYVETISVDVQRAYTGAGTGALQIDQAALNGGGGITPGGDISINTTNTGYRSMTATAASGAQAGDVNVAALARTLCPAIFMQLTDADNNGATGCLVTIKISVTRRH